MISFARFFAEQDFFEVLGLFAGFAAVYVALFAAVALVVSRRRLDGSTLRTGVATGAVVLGVFVVGLTLFEAAALYYRSVPHGEGVQRTGEDFETFVDRFRLLFVALYASAIAVACALGYAVGRWLGSPRAVATLTLTTLVGFLLLSLPAVEYQNSCDIGKSLFIEADC